MHEWYYGITLGCEHIYVESGSVWVCVHRHTHMHTHLTKKAAKITEAGETLCCKISCSIILSHL